MRHVPSPRLAAPEAVPGGVNISILSPTSHSRWNIKIVKNDGVRNALTHLLYSWTVPKLYQLLPVACVAELIAFKGTHTHLSPSVSCSRYEHAAGPVSDSDAVGNWDFRSSSEPSGCVYVYLIVSMSA